MGTQSRPPPARADGGEDARQAFGTSPVRNKTNQNPKLLTWTVDPDAIIDNVGRGKQALQDPLGQADEFRGSRGRGLDRRKEVRYEGSEISEAVGSRPKHDDSYG